MFKSEKLADICAIMAGSSTMRSIRDKIWSMVAGLKMAIIRQLMVDKIAVSISYSRILDLKVCLNMVLLNIVVALPVYAIEVLLQRIFVFP